MVKIYYDISTYMCVVAGRDYSAGGFVLDKTSDNKVIIEKDRVRIVDCVPLANIRDAAGDPYADYATFRAALKDFFVKASQGGAMEDISDVDFVQDFQSIINNEA